MGPLTAAAEQPHGPLNRRAPDLRVLIKGALSAVPENVA